MTPANDSLQGYDVRYEYRGREYTTHLSQAPGRYQRLGQEIRGDGMPFDADVAYASPSYPDRPAQLDYGSGG